MAAGASPWRDRLISMGWAAAATVLLCLAMGNWWAPGWCGWLVFPGMALWVHHMVRPMAWERPSSGSSQTGKPVTRWKQLRASFGRGYWSGFLFFGLMFGWLWNVFPGANVFLGLYLALFPATWCLFARPLLRAPSLPNVLAAAGAWTCLEWLRGWILTGFGWNGLSVALVATPTPIHQLAEWIGGNGIGFFILFTVLSASYLPGKQRWIGLALFIALHGVGLLLKRAAEAEPTQLAQIRLVQPNVLQADRWALQEREIHYSDFSQEEQDKIVTDIQSLYSELKRLSAAPSVASPIPHLVVWPESSFYYELHTPDHDTLVDSVLGEGKAAQSLFLGTDIKLEGSFNGSALFTGNATVRQIYAKSHLVPFGEYLPLRPLLEPMLGGLLPLDFDTGALRQPLTLGPLVPGSTVPCQIIPSICFEDTLGRVAREFIRPAPQILVNITNDGWFGPTEAVEVHFRNSLYRSIELRRPAVRSANTGVTAAVAHTGRVLDRLLPHRTGSLDTTVPVPQTGRITLYARWGEWFSCLVGLLACVQKLRSRRSPPAGPVSGLS